MKKRRILRKVLRPKLILIYILVIVLGVVGGTYVFGGFDRYLLDVKAGNLPYNKEEFVDINTMLADDTWGTQEDLAELNQYIIDNASSELSEEELKEQYFNEVYGLKPGVKVYQNEKYVMYFNKITTIATVYEIDRNAIDGEGNVDISKCEKYYTTAVPYAGDISDVKASGKSANVELSYLNSQKGSLENVAIDSVTGSTKYINPLTKELERHYSLNFTDKGVQVEYQLGKFSAGAAYFPEYMYMTMYKPDKSAFINKRTNELDEEKYNAHVAMWEDYMAMLGLENAMDASYDRIIAALSGTFEEMFRGNCRVYIKEDLNGVSRPEAEKATWSYSNTMEIYTREGFEYIKGLIDSGEIDGSYRDNDVENGSAVEGKTNNVYWNVNLNDPDMFFTAGEGVYFNCEGSPLTINLSLVGKAYNLIQQSAYVPYEGSNEEGAIKYPYYDVQSMGDMTQIIAYKLMYSYDSFEYVDSIYGFPCYDVFNNPIIQGGIFEFDEDGYRVYDSNGIAKKTCFTLDKTADINAMFSVETSTSLPVFSLVLDFTLNEDGLEVTLLGNSLVDSSNASKNKIVINEIGDTIDEYNKIYNISDIKVLPYMNYVDNSKNAVKETGKIVIPDGSGAVINFNNGKSNLGATALNASFYGKDYTYTTQYMEEETMDLMLGMYGFIYDTPSNPRGVLSILEKGGNQVSLYANTNDTEARAYFSCRVREYKDIKIGNTIYAKKFTKWSYNLCDTDYKFNFIFLGENEADYVSLANKYRDYLIERDGITVKDDSKDTVVDLNFLGSFEKYALFLGFKYKTPDHLTTFNQAEDIIEELSNGVDVNGQTLKVNDFNVSYTGWTSEELAYKAGGNVKIASALGGKSEMRDFSKYLDSKGIDFYPEAYVATTYGYDYSFGNLKYTARNIANETAIRYQFNLATLRPDKKLTPTYVVRPDFYMPFANDLLEELDDLKITKNNKNSKQSGYYFVDLGNMTARNFSKGEEIFGDAVIQYQKDVLSMIAEDYKIKLKAPYDYALKYADFITNIPLTSTQKQIYDETIPLYQLVISGLVDYTVDTINGTGNKGAGWYYAKALETGSNLSFQISYQNPAVLLETDYTYFYQAYYKNWKEEIVTMASEIDALGIHGGRLVDHENVGKNIAYVKYLLGNGSYVELLVNSTMNDFNYNGVLTSQEVVVPAYGCVKL